MKVQRQQPFVRLAGKRFQPFVRRQGRSGRAQTQRRSPEQLPMVRHMPRPQLRPRQFHGGLQLLPARLGNCRCGQIRIFVEAPIARRGYQQDGGCPRAGHAQLISLHTDAPALGHHLHARLEAHADAFGLVIRDRLLGPHIVRLTVRRSFARQPERAIRRSLRLRLQQAVERQHKIPASQPHHQSLLRRRREHLARMRTRRHTRDAAVQIQFTPVIRGRAARLRELDHQVPQRLIGLVIRPLHLLTKRIGRRVILLLHHQPPDLRQVILRVRIVPRLRPPRPQRIVIQLQPFALYAAEHHRAAH